MEEKTKPQARTRDLGKGSIPKLLAQLAIPVVVAQIVNLLYNIVDRIYIGHIPGIGAAALTGVGLFAPLLICCLVQAEHQEQQYSWERGTMKRQRRSWQTAFH